MGNSSTQVAVVGLLVCCSVFSGGAARAQSLGNLAEGEALVLPVEAGVLSSEIAVEIDGIDMTDFVTVMDGQLMLSGGLPLGPGAHEVLVYRLTDDGYEVIASFDFSTSGGGGGAVSVSATAQHEVGVRSVNGDVEGVGESSGQIEVTTVDNRLTVTANYLATSVEENQINGNAVDLGEYFIEMRQSGALFDITARLGHQMLSYDAALVGDITRRGLSVMVATPDERFSAGLFGTRVADLLGADNLTGLERGEDRMFGGQLAWRPFAQSDMRLKFQAYEGEGAPDFGLTPGIGKGASVALDGSLAAGRLRYGLTLGATEWDEDGDGAVYDPVAGTAVLAHLGYDLIGADGGPRSLTLGFDYEIVEADYFSLANPDLPVAREDYRVTADYAAERLSLSFVAETQRTNVDGPDTLETDRITRIALDGGYDLRAAGWLSDAHLTFGAELLRQDRLETPPMAIDPQDFTGTTLYAGLERYGDVSSWGVQYLLLDQNDRSALDQDYISHTLSAWAEHPLSDAASLSLSGSATYVDDGALTWWDNELVLGLSYDLVPGEWSLTAEAGMTEYGLGLDRGSYVSAELSWSFAPSADLVFSAGYYDGLYAGESGAGHDAIVALMLRANTNYLR